MKISTRIQFPLLVIGITSLLIVGCNQNNDNVKQGSGQTGETSENKEPQSTEGNSPAGTTAAGNSSSEHTKYPGKSSSKVPTQTPVQTPSEEVAAQEAIRELAVESNPFLGSWRESKEHISFLVPGDENTKVTFRHFVRFTGSEFIPWIEVACANGTSDLVQLYANGITYSNATENLKYKFDGEFITFSNTNNTDWVSQKQVCGKEFTLTFGTGKIAPVLEGSVLKMKKIRNDQTQSAELSFERYSS
jgi:hypothetical protein